MKLDKTVDRVDPNATSEEERVRREKEAIAEMAGIPADEETEEKERE